MEAFRELREKNKIIKALVAWQKTVWYPVFYAVCGVLSCSFGWQVYVPVFYVLALSVLFAALFCDDIKVLLVPVFLTYFCIGSDVELNLDISTGNVFETWTTVGLVNMIIAGAILIGAIVFRKIRRIFSGVSNRERSFVSQKKFSCRLNRSSGPRISKLQNRRASSRCGYTVQPGRGTTSNVSSTEIWQESFRG